MFGKRGAIKPVIVIFGLIVILSMHIVSAETVGSQFFSNIFGGSFDFSGLSDSVQAFMATDRFLQILIFALVALVIYSISPFLPFISDNKLVTWGVTLIVAFLAVFSLRIEEIKTILLSYGALGLVITGIIPFFAIAALSKKFYEEGKPSFVSKVIWLVFFTLILVRWWSADPQEIGNFGKFVYPIVLILVLMMFLFEKKFYFHLIKNKIKEGIGVLNSSSNRRTLGKIAEMHAEAGALEASGRPEDAAAIRSNIRKMESSLKKS
jgi:hypothetical protein